MVDQNRTIDYPLGTLSLEQGSIGVMKRNRISVKWIMAVFKRVELAMAVPELLRTLGIVE